MVQQVFSFVIILLEDELDTYSTTLYLISIWGRSFLFWINPKSIRYVEKEA